MKAGSFNIQEYLNKIHEMANEKEYNAINEQEAGSLPDPNGLIIPEENKKAYDWLKGEYQHGKTEVKVEMSYHNFKPGYFLQDAPDSTKKFPGMYGDGFKPGKGGEQTEKQASFPQTTFPTMRGKVKSGETDGTKQSKTSKDTESNESSETDNQKDHGIKVEAKTKKPKIFKKK